MCGNLQFCIEVVHYGEMAKAAPKTPGSLVTISYRLIAPSLSHGVLEKSQKSCFQYGCGGIAPELDATVAELGLYGKAICKARTPMRLEMMILPLVF